jgi:hypothetical protein
MKSTPFSRYAASKEGVAIINATAKIPSLAVRRRIINFVESLSASIKLKRSLSELLCLAYLRTADEAIVAGRP